MAALIDRADARPPFERRRRRAAGLADALRFQLDACREDGGLDAIVVSDDLGFCVAHSGARGEHDELAAYLPMLAAPARGGHDAIDDADLSLWSRAPVAVTTFLVHGTTLHACALAGPGAGEPDTRSAVGRASLERVAQALSRLLAQ
jgi:hypothetical protein